MKILSVCCSAPEGEADVHLIAVFGVGLVGGAVCGDLYREGAVCVQRLAIDWTSGPAVEEAVLRVYETVRQLEGGASRSLRLSVVWAAGGAGFQSPEAAHLLELEHFKKVLSLGERLAHPKARGETRFFLVSSAGGLFEGQRNVGPTCPPVPLRAYGTFKLLQEEALERAGGFHASFVYRPSTVYGHSPKGRVGLVSALLLNGIRHRVSTISGSATTLRDFVFNGDVGRFIAAEILAPSEKVGLTRRFLVSGKPSSILEISRIAEDLLGRRLYLAYHLGPQNALHNSYSPAAVARGWRSTSLREGMQAVLRGVMLAEVAC